MYEHTIKCYRQFLIFVFVMSFLFVVLTVSSALAAEKCSLLVDGVLISDKAPKYDFQPQIYTDVAPEIKNNMAYVPLRFVAELFGANVSCKEKTVEIEQNQTKITLTIGQNGAFLNDQTIALEGASYAKNGRTMVPLRFIAEAFDCNVDYAKGAVTITTSPLTIDNKIVAVMRSEGYMTMGGTIYEFTGNIYLRNYYAALQSGIVREAAAPEHFGNMVNYDVMDWYSGLAKYHFMDSNGQIIKTLTPYDLVYDGKFTDKELPLRLLHDETADKWYEFNDTVMAEAAKWRSMMKSIEISNTIA